MTEGTITTAPGKPEKILINYTTVRPAELNAIYEYIEQQGATSITTLVERFAPTRSTGRDKGHITDCLRFLRALDLVGRPEDRVVDPMNRSVFADFSFEVKLLGHLRAQPYPQNHLWKLYGVALDKADRTLSLEQLLPEVERELDEYDFTWNEEKLRMWRELMRQLGVITETATEGVILSPCRALMHELLTAHADQYTNDLYEALDWIEEHFLQMFKTRVGAPELHPAISDVLQNMEADDLLSFRSMTDAQQEVKLPTSHSHPNSRRVKLYDIQEAPDRPAYRYPLSQERSEVMA